MHLWLIKKRAKQAISTHQNSSTWPEKGRCNSWTTLLRWLKSYFCMLKVS